MNIGDRIKRFRKRKNLTQKELGILAGFDSITADVRIAQYESGKRRPKEKYINRMAYRLDVSPYALDIPDVKNNYILSQLLFALEDEYNFQIGADENGRPCLYADYADNMSWYNFLESWKRHHDMMLNGEISQEEYDNWRYLYPTSSAREWAQMRENLRKKIEEENE